MGDVLELILKEVSVSGGAINSLDVASKFKLDHQKVVGAIKSLQSLGNVIQSTQRSEVRWGVTGEGGGVVERGSHEAILFNRVPPSGNIKQSQLMTLVGGVVGKVGFSKAMSLGWIGVDKKAEGGAVVFRKVEKIEDRTQSLCKRVFQDEMDGVTEGEKDELKKRKLIAEVKVVYYEVGKGDDFALEVTKQETELTQEMINSGSWRNKGFKAYNFASKGLLPPGGHLHPLLKVRTQFRQIFLEMGFKEMPTNNFVESSFWNFDVLFQPQQHPARDAHDTFFVSDPPNSTGFPMEYLERVKEVHSKGGYGSQGYNYTWKIEEARKNIMRTHTTAVSARVLYHLATMDTFSPQKYFSIDRVFRNESLDATHLAEFHQIEGLVADYDLSLGHLMGYIKEFFKKCGMTKLKFKPAYNPYTEPSMEIFSYHQGLKKWVEIGNSGVFRPEMLLPMGLPPRVSVIAWGLSLERPTMIKYGISNIRDLFGPKVDLQTVYDNPICRLGGKERKSDGEVGGNCVGMGGNCGEIGGKGVNMGEHGGGIGVNGGGIGVNGGGIGVNGGVATEIKSLENRQINLIGKLRSLTSTVGGMIEKESKNGGDGGSGGFVKSVTKIKSGGGGGRGDASMGGGGKGADNFGGFKPTITSPSNFIPQNCPFEVVLEIDPHILPSPAILPLILLIKSSSDTLVSSSIHSSLQDLPDHQKQILIALFNHQETYDEFVRGGLKGVRGKPNNKPNDKLENLATPVERTTKCESISRALTYCDRLCHGRILTVIWRRSEQGMTLKGMTLKTSSLSLSAGILQYLSSVFLDQSTSSSLSSSSLLPSSLPPSSSSLPSSLPPSSLPPSSLPPPSSKPRTNNFTNFYPSCNPIISTSIDDILEEMASEPHPSKHYVSQMEAMLGMSNGPFLHGCGPSLADLVLWQSGFKKDEGRFKKWKDACADVFGRV